jgi:hypothetical protein
MPPACVVRDTILNLLRELLHHKVYRSLTLPMIGRWTGSMVHRKGVAGDWGPIGPSKDQARHRDGRGQRFSLFNSQAAAIAARPGAESDRRSGLLARPCTAVVSVVSPVLDRRGLIRTQPQAR